MARLSIFGQPRDEMGNSGNVGSSEPTPVKPGASPATLAQPNENQFRPFQRYVGRDEVNRRASNMMRPLPARPAPIQPQPQNPNNGPGGHTAPAMPPLPNELPGNSQIPEFPPMPSSPIPSPSSPLDPSLQITPPSPSNPMPSSPIPNPILNAAPRNPLMQRDQMQGQFPMPAVSPNWQRSIPPTLMPFNFQQW